MINPLLHPHSSSAPTSPRCTRQIRIRNRTTVVSTAGNVVMRAVPKKYREMSPSRRRLSRVVKCRTVDFTEFPEGMRDYYSGGGVRNKQVLREIHSQPGSPVIPRIEIYDFGSEVLLINYYTLFLQVSNTLWIMSDRGVGQFFENTNSGIIWGSIWFQLSPDSTHLRISSFKHLTIYLPVLVLVEYELCCWYIKYFEARTILKVVHS